jgi:hypothetical protein
MATSMLGWVAKHPLMMEEAGSGPLNTGVTAYRILMGVSSSCEVNELLAAICPADIRNRFESLNLPDRLISQRFPSKEILLGAILEAHYLLVTQHPDDHLSAQAIDLDVIESGFHRAFRLAAEASSKATSTNDADADGKDTHALHVSGPTTEGRTIMPYINSEPWDLTLVLDKAPTTQFERFGLTLGLQNCVTLGQVSRCDLSGELRDTAGNVYRVNGRRWLIGRSGSYTLEFNLRGINIIFTAWRNDASFSGKFIALDRQVEKADVGPLDPDTGDTGTGVGSQTLLTADRRA